MEDRAKLTHSIKHVNTQKVINNLSNRELNLVLDALARRHSDGTEMADVFIIRTDRHLTVVIRDLN